MLVVQVAHPQASDVLIKQLAYENANADCKKALAPIKEKGSLSECIQVCQQGVFIAALEQVLRPTPDICFTYGKKGTYAQRLCRLNQYQASQSSGNNNNNKPAPGLCPRCKKGNHWANKCQSRYHKDRTLLTDFKPRKHEMEHPPPPSPRPLLPNPSTAVGHIQ
jgi:hypothetical protein